mmetsp:Transcript_30202/g.80565  ORF Transcript_30202/g.80565 Transcript_30202/m.80565 type:complete len:202 (-) Transcript_30202:333-938(-)
MGCADTRTDCDGESTALSWRTARAAWAVSIMAAWSLPRAGATPCPKTRCETASVISRTSKSPGSAAETTLATISINSDSVRGMHITTSVAALLNPCAAKLRVSDNKSAPKRKRWCCAAIPGTRSTRVLISETKAAPARFSSATLFPKRFRTVTATTSSSLDASIRPDLETTRSWRLALSGGIHRNSARATASTAQAAANCL